MRRRSRSTLAACLISVLGLVLAACGGSDGGSSASPPTTTAIGPRTPVAGCGEGSFTDPELFTADRPIARCEPGAPAPRPLPTRQKVTISVAAPGVFFSQLHLADVLGEFDKENLDVELVKLVVSDALPQIAAGGIDGYMGGPEAVFWNARNGGIDIKWVLGAYVPADGGDLTIPQSGLYLRRDAFSNPSDPDLAELSGKKVAIGTGLGSTLTLPIQEILEPHGVSVDELTLESTSAGDRIIALENGAVAAGWFSDPYWTELAGKDDFVMVGTQSRIEPISGLILGPRLTTQQPEVGEALVRAMVRTTNTYLDGDYGGDPKVVSALQEATGLSAQVIQSAAPLVFDWEIRAATAARYQDLFLELGVLSYTTPLDPREAVDPTLYRNAVGR